MRVDMHYYGIYCLARTAGINAEAAATIARASQYTDDSTAREVDNRADGSKIIAVPTAHHTADIRNLEHNDQRYIWVPFHFLPGGEGDSFLEKLICRKNSAISQEMVQHNLKQADKPYFLELVGITAHVYADTFSHYGFSGVSSKTNRVNGEDIKIENPSPLVENMLGPGYLSDFFKRFGQQGGLSHDIGTTIKSDIASKLQSWFRSLVSGAAEEAGALGHGPVSVYPDHPYLKWSFEYQFPCKSLEKKSKRDNQVAYLEGCESIHEMFSVCAGNHKAIKDSKSSRKFSAVKDLVKEILAAEKNDQDRCEIWKAAARDGQILIKKEEIPTYDSIALEKQRVSFLTLKDQAQASNLEVYRFYQAASFHGHYVLRELLPKHGMIVV